MDRYAILKDNELEFAPLNKENISNYCYNVELMVADGYKLYVEDEREEGKKYHESYKETKTRIRLVLTEFTEEEYEIAYRQEKDKLFLTPSDVERALYYGMGLDFEDLKALIAQQAPTIDLKALSIEFRANNFYRGATDRNGTRLVDTIGTFLGLTCEELDYLFENKTLPSETIARFNS